MPPLHDEGDGNNQNMVSNLPLLFAGGYPTSLDKITEKQLERFIPFMVQCSLGYLQLTPVQDFTEPEWWPQDIKIPRPFLRPADFTGDWLARLKELVVMCYNHHNSVFLLRFCYQLAKYEPASLRFINNHNSTTSLYHRTTNKLLVTFRNENMLYDQPPTTPRKSLLPKSPSAHAVDTQMVEASLFDIYLCDNCDAELYSLEAYKEHEKVCIVSDAVDDEDDEDDDVILVDENELDDSATVSKDQPDFLSNFGLFSSSNNNNNTSITTGTGAKRKHGSQSFLDPFSPEKRRLPANRSRAVLPLSKCHPIPISSPAGLLLLKQTKTVQSDEYKLERIDRLERFCAAPAMCDDQAYNRYMTTLSRLRAQNTVNVTFRKPTEPGEPYTYHVYKWPRRQFSTKVRRAHFMFLNSLLLKACRPLSVKVKRLSDTDIEIQKAKLRLAAQKVSFAVPRIKAKVVEYIDLCSSDEEREDDVAHTKLNQTAPVVSTTTVTNPSTTLSLVGDENRRVNGNILMSMPANTPTFPVNQGVGVQPLRPSVFLFSNYQNANNANTTTTGFFPTGGHTESMSKNNTIKRWLESQTSSPIPSKLPRLVNIQQYATTTIRTTITAADVAT